MDRYRLKSNSGEKKEVVSFVRAFQNLSLAVKYFPLISHCSPFLVVINYFGFGLFLESSFLFESIWVLCSFCIDWIDIYQNDTNDL